MTCEDEPHRITWEVQLYEPFSQVWMSRGYGRATTTASPADIAQAVLAGYLAAHPPRPRETFRGLAYTDTGTPCIITADQLPDGSWQASDAVRQALPLHLRDALPACG